MKYEGLGLFNAFTFSIKIILLYSPIFFIVKLLMIEKYYNILISALFLNILFLALGSIFSSYLIDLNLLKSLDEISIYSNTSIIRRDAGFFIGSGGDSNSLSGYLVIMIALFYNSRPFRSNFLTYIIISIVSISIIFMGSRSAVFSLLFIILLNLNFKNSGFLVLLAFVGFFFIPQEVFDFLSTRFGNLESEVDSQKEDSRIYIWGIYFFEIINNYSTLFFGATKHNLSNSIPFVPHNFYLTLTYRWGIFPLIYLVILISNFIKAKVIKNNVNLIKLNLSIIIPFFITSFVVSDTGVFLAFILALAFSRIDEKKKTENIYTKHISIN